MPGQDNARLVGAGVINKNQSPAGISATPILIPTNDPLDDIAAHIDGTFVLVVRTTDDRYRRRCFLSAASAERAARKAQAAGHEAEVYLAELKPLWKLTGGEVAS
jgi:hypothetical protein